MLASLGDRFSEDPLGFLILGAAIALVFLLVERVLRTLFRRRELEENQYQHRTSNELPRALGGDGQQAVTKLVDDLEPGETIRQ